MSYFSVLSNVYNQTDLHILQSSCISSLEPKENEMQSATSLNIVCLAFCCLIKLK